MALGQVVHRAQGCIPVGGSRTAVGRLLSSMYSSPPPASNTHGPLVSRPRPSTGNGSLFPPACAAVAWASVFGDLLFEIMVFHLSQIAAPQGCLYTWWRPHALTCSLERTMSHFGEFLDRAQTSTRNLLGFGFYTWRGSGNNCVLYFCL